MKVRSSFWSFWSVWTFWIVGLILFCIAGRAQTPVKNPAAAWSLVKPEAAGYSSARLEVLRAWLKTEPTTAMMIIAHGDLIFSYGDTAHVSKIASVRKSVLDLLRWGSMS